MTWDRITEALLGRSWEPLRVLLVGVLSYAVLVATIRVAGNRTLAKMNAFDLIVTVALGSTLASILTSKSVAFVEGASALVLLVALQFISHVVERANALGEALRHGRAGAARLPGRAA